MALYLVLLTAILAFSLASTEQCVSSAGSSIDLSLHSMKNASGHWIISVHTRRLTGKENLREFSVNVQQETRICGRYEIEELISVALAYPSLHDISIPGAIEASATRPTTTTTAAPSTSISTTAAPSTSTTTTAAPSTSTTTTATPSTSTTTTATPSTSTNTTATPSTSTTTTATPSTSTTTTATPSTTTTTPSTTTTAKACPHSGYQLYPEFNCYKAFPSSGEYRTWSEARERCKRDGGDLMIMESERERREVYIPLYNSVTWDDYYDAPWVGVYIPQGGKDWMTVKGQPVLSTWWRPGYPKKDAALKCAQADINGHLKSINNCTVTRPFICEINSAEREQTTPHVSCLYLIKTLYK